MPKPRKGPRLGSGPAHERLLLNGLAAQLFVHEGIKTTEAKAKAVRGRVERMISLAKRGDLTARRAVVAEFPNEPLVVKKLFDEIAPRYADRPSGFTRIVRLGARRGDAAEIVQLELV